MVFTYTEFNDIVNFAVEMIYFGFKTLNDFKVYSDNGVTISLLDIMIGIMLVYVIVDEVLEYLRGGNE